MIPEDKYKSISQVRKLINQAAQTDPTVHPELINHAFGHQAEINENLSNQELEEIIDQETDNFPEQIKDSVLPSQKIGISSFIDPGAKHVMGEGNWFRDIATDQQLIDHAREYIVLLKIAMLAEEIRQTQQQGAFDQILQVLDTYWGLKKDGKPNFTQSSKPKFNI